MNVGDRLDHGRERRLSQQAEASLAGTIPGPAYRPMNGVQLAAEARHRHPTLAVLMTSGYSAEVLQTGLNGLALLRKPYDQEALTRRLHEALNAAA